MRHLEEGFAKAMISLTKYLIGYIYIKRFY